jgi:hypothetical protein
VDVRLVAAAVDGLDDRPRRPYPALLYMNRGSSVLRRSA